MEKIILFYKYINFDNPSSIVKAQQKVCKRLGLKGRIIVAHEGINGTLGGTSEAIDQYVNSMRENPCFADIDFKESIGSAIHFPRLRVVLRPEIVSLKVNPQHITAHNGGKHISPEKAHLLLNSPPKDFVIFDARNNYESNIGTFKGSITPDIKNFRDLPQFIDKNIEQFKDKVVLMHCTGGVRCERASAYLKAKNVAKEIYQLEGGIQRYVEKYPDGHFRGKLYVFDGRVSVKVNDDILAECINCQQPYDDYSNCINASCNMQIVLCSACIKYLENCCSTACMQLVKEKKVVIRTIPKKIDKQDTPCKKSQ